MSVKDFSKITGIFTPPSDWKRRNTNLAADKIMTFCQIVMVTPESLLGESSSSLSSNVDAAINISIDTQEYRLIESYRSLNSDTKKLLWAYLDALAIINSLLVSDSPS